MLALTAQTQIFVALDAIDFRCGIDRLAQLCRAKLAHDPMEGAVFVFRNRRQTAIKLLMYDGQGFWLCQKRFSSGKLQWWPAKPNITDLSAPNACHEIVARELQILLWNGNPDQAAMAEDWRSLSNVKVA